jgi:hypothetical protein
MDNSLEPLLLLAEFCNSINDENMGYLHMERRGSSQKCAGIRSQAHPVLFFETSNGPKLETVNQAYHVSSNLSLATRPFSVFQPLHILSLFCMTSQV